MELQRETDEGNPYDTHEERYQEHEEDYEYEDGVDAEISRSRAHRYS